jgi:hypothetical protein
MKLFLICLFLICTSAHAQYDPNVFTNAITACPESNNPLAVAKRLGANQFKYPAASTRDEVTTINVRAYYNPYLISNRYGNVASILAQLLVKMSYDASGNLTCSSEVANLRQLTLACIEVNRQKFEMNTNCHEGLQFVSLNNNEWHFRAFNGEREERQCRIDVYTTGANVRSEVECR